MPFLVRILKRSAISIVIALQIAIPAAAAPYGCGEFSAGEFNEGTNSAASAGGVSCAASTGGSGGSGGSDNSGGSGGSGGLADTGEDRSRYLLWGSVALVVAGSGIAFKTFASSRKKQYRLR